jgi:hypothetical protein
MAFYTDGSFVQRSVGCTFKYEDKVFSYHLHSYNRMYADFVRSATTLVMLPPLLRFPECVAQSPRVYARPWDHFGDSAVSVPSPQGREFCLYFDGCVATQVCQGIWLLMLLLKKPLYLEL